MWPMTPKGSRTPSATATRNDAARRFHRRRRWLVLKRSLAALVLVAATSAGIIAWKLGYTSAWRHQAWSVITVAVEDAGPGVESISVSGRKRTPHPQILAALGADRGSPIMAVDLERARERLEALGWVKSATVRRHLPGTIAIDIKEREPYALWQHDGQTRLIDRDGVVITGDGLERFKDLQLVVGAGAAENTSGLVAMLASEPALRRRVRAAVRVGGRRWQLRFDNGVTVELPEYSPGTAWTRLAVLERDHGILERAIRIIDMRLPDRTIVRLAPKAERRRRIAERRT